MFEGGGMIDIGKDLQGAFDDGYKQGKQDGWTPINKKWPDKNGRYLVTYREWSKGEYLPKFDNTEVRILKYHEAIFRLPKCIDKEAEKDMNREVLAWQSLPEPYKE